MQKTVDLESLFADVHELVTNAATWTVDRLHRELDVIKARYDAALAEEPAKGPVDQPVEEPAEKPTPKRARRKADDGE